MMNREIPGFYFDKAKNRYFKIQPGSNGPSSAAYNADNVKKRRTDDQQAEETRKRQHRLRHHIKRASVLAHPLAGARLVREFGHLDRELPVETWTRGLRCKGAVDFSSNQSDPSIPCMLVNGDDQQTGMGLIYAATHDETQITGCYIPTDQEDHINFNADPLARRSRFHELRRERILFNSLNSISYHRASHKILLTCMSPRPNLQTGDHHSSVILFSPPLSTHAGDHPFSREPRPHPSWLLGENSVQMVLTHPSPTLTIRAARVAPPSHGGSALAAVLATSNGVVRVTDGEQPIQPLVPPEEQSAARGFKGRSPPQDILAVDWHPTNPAVVFAGARDGRLLRADTRAPRWGPGGWESCLHRSSAAHLRAIDDHQILAAGPRGAMAVYDLRWLAGGLHRRSGMGRGGREARPVATMVEYRNAARLDLGLDVATIGGGMGKAAAAGMDDGTVGVFSLRSGKRLKAGAVDDVRLGDGAVVKSLQWEKMPWERETSLWVAIGAEVRKFSFGLDDGEDGDY